MYQRIAVCLLVSITLVLFLYRPAQGQNDSVTFSLIEESNERLGGFGVPSLNNAGTVAFTAVPAGRGAVLTGSAGSCCITIVDTSGPFRGFLIPSINIAGTVVVRADLNQGGEALIIGSPSNCCTTIVDTSGPFRSFDFPAINDAGTVAFHARGNNVDGVFTGSQLGCCATVADISREFRFF